jgi:hypothetical protein
MVSGYGPMVGSCKYGNELFGFFESKEFEELGHYQILKKNSRAWSQYLRACLQ